MSAKRKDEEAIFYAALELKSAAERSAYLKSACGDDVGLLGRVEALLKVHDSERSVLEAAASSIDMTLEIGPLAEGPGTKIGRYKLLELIGEGGFGVVYMAEQREPIRRRVALKIIKLGMDTKQVIARFEAERQALAMMEHPNIAKVLDAGATDTGRPYFVMELVKGIPITEYCDKNNLDTQQRLELFIEVCKAVQHAHQKGIIHRDIKPSNVLITLRDDDSPVPKIIDFGIAKATQARLTEKTLFTEFKQFVGTPEYMSPEQARMGELDVDTRSDIYSLGVLLYELLTGTTPFDAKQLRSAAFDEIVRIIREEEPDKPSTRLSALGDTLVEVAKHRHVEPGELCKIIQGDLDWIVLKTLEKDRTRRYETVNELAQDIKRHLGDEPVVAGPPSTIYRMKKFVRRNRALVTSVAVVLVVLMTGIVASTIFAVGQARARARADQAREKEAAARTEAVAAREKAKQAESVAQQERQLTQRLLARAQLKRGVRLLNEGNGLGLLDLLEAWKTAEEIPDLRDSIGRLWAIAYDLWSGRLVHVMPSGNNLTISPQGKLLAIGSLHNAQLWDTATGQPHGPPLQLEKIIGAVVFSPDGQLLVTHSVEGMSQLYHTVTGQARGPILRHDFGSPKREFASWRLADFFWSADFSPDGKLLATAYLDGAVQLWETDTGRPYGQPLRHEAEVLAVAFSPDGKLLASGAGDNTARLWEVASGQPHCPPLRHKATVRKLAFSQDGKLVVTMCGWRAYLWETNTGQLQKQLLNSGWVMDLAFSPNGRLLATGSWDYTAQLWDVATGQPSGKPLHHGGRVNTLAFSPDGSLLATGARDRTTRLWEVASGKAYGQALPHLSLNPSRIAFSPNGEFITITAGGMPTRIFKTYQQFKTEVVRHRRGFGLGAISPDGKVGAVISGNTVQLWDTTTLKPLGEPLRHEGKVGSVVFSPDGELLACGCKWWNKITDSFSWNIRLWKVADSRSFGPTLKTSDVLALAFSPDGKLLANGTSGWKAHIFDVTTGEYVHVVNCQDWVCAVAFSPDGKVLATGEENGMVELWDMATGQQLGPMIQHLPSILAVSFSPDGNLLATVSATVSGNEDQTVRIWDISTPPPYQSLALPPLPVRGKEALESFSTGGTILISRHTDDAAQVWRLPDPPSDLNKTQLQTWIALGAQHDQNGDVVSIPWEQWRKLREELNASSMVEARSGDYYEVPLSSEPDREEQERRLMENFKIQSSVLGEEHPDTLGSMSNLAVVYVDQGRYDEAEQLYIKVLEGCRREWGNEHAWTVWSLNNLIELYETWGKPQLAEQWRGKLAKQKKEKEVESLEDSKE